MSKIDECRLASVAKSWSIRPSACLSSSDGYVGFIPLLNLEGKLAQVISIVNNIKKSMVIFNFISSNY